MEQIGRTSPPPIIEEEISAEAKTASPSSTLSHLGTKEVIQVQEEKNIQAAIVITAADWKETLEEAQSTSTASSNFTFEGERISACPSERSDGKDSITQTADHQAQEQGSFAMPPSHSTTQNTIDTMEYQLSLRRSGVLGNSASNSMNRSISLTASSQETLSLDLFRNLTTNEEQEHTPLQLAHDEMGFPRLDPILSSTSDRVAQGRLYRKTVNSFKAALGNDAHHFSGLLETEATVNGLTFAMIRNVLDHIDGIEISPSIEKVPSVNHQAAVVMSAVTTPPQVEEVITPLPSHEPEDASFIPPHPSLMTATTAYHHAEKHPESHHDPAPWQAAYDEISVLANNAIHEAAENLLNMATSTAAVTMAAYAARAAANVARLTAIQTNVQVQFITSSYLSLTNISSNANATARTAIATAHQASEAAITMATTAETTAPTAAIQAAINARTATLQHCERGLSMTASLMEGLPEKTSLENDLATATTALEAARADHTIDALRTAVDEVEKALCTAIEETPMDTNYHIIEEARTIADAFFSSISMAKKTTRGAAQIPTQASVALGAAATAILAAIDVEQTRNEAIDAAGGTPKPPQPPSRLPQIPPSKDRT